MVTSENYTKKIIHLQAIIVKGDFQSILPNAHSQPYNVYKNIKKSHSVECKSICYLLQTMHIEQFSFESRKVIGFAITMLHNWLKKLAPLFQPIRSKTKTNCNSRARIFLHFTSATCNYYEF